jgi:pimeloyl-ACP methyl ester carboxylesterase
VEGLCGEFACLAFDNRGVGESTADTAKLTIDQMAEDALAVMDAAGWPSAHLAGHSMGGLIAREVALRAPERVRSLALLCTFSRGPEAARMTPQIVWMGIRTRIGSPAMRRAGFLRMLYPAQYLDTCGDLARLAEETGRTLGRDLADTPSIVMKQLGAMRRYQASGESKSLAGMPTLVVSAEHDPIALPRFGRKLAAEIPGSRYVEIAGASHAVTLQMAERINALLREHWRAHTSG